MSTLSLLNSHSLLTIPTISTHTQTCSTVSLCPCSYCCSPFVLWWKSVWCISLCAIPGKQIVRVCVCVCGSFVCFTLFPPAYSSHQLWTMNCTSTVIWSDRSSMPVWKNYSNCCRKPRFIRTNVGRGKQAATSARVFMAFTTLNVWFRLSLVSILVFITMITKLVVKEQLRITVYIHRYHHNTYLD